MNAKQTLDALDRAAQTLKSYDARRIMREIANNLRATMQRNDAKIALERAYENQTDRTSNQGRHQVAELQRRYAELENVNLAQLVAEAQNLLASWNDF